MDETSTFLMSPAQVDAGMGDRHPPGTGRRAWRAEREVGRYEAGLRAQILVGLARCEFTLVAWELYQHIRSIEQPTRGDPVQIIEAVTAGMF